MLRKNACGRSCPRTWRRIARRAGCGTCRKSSGKSGPNSSGHDRLYRHQYGRAGIGHKARLFPDPRRMGRGTIDLIGISRLWPVPATSPYRSALMSSFCGTRRFVLDGDGEATRAQPSVPSQQARIICQTNDPCHQPGLPQSQRSWSIRLQTVPGASRSVCRRPHLHGGMPTGGTPQSQRGWRVPRQTVPGASRSVCRISHLHGGMPTGGEVAGASRASPCPERPAPFPNAIRRDAAIAA